MLCFPVTIGGGGKIGDGKKAFDFIESIPNSYSFKGDSKFDSKYLGNDSKFSAINSEFQKLFNKYTEGGSYLLTPMIIPYTMQQFDDIIWDKRSGVRAGFDRRDKMKQGMEQDDTVPRLEENKTNKMNNEFKRMQELSGVPVKEEKENLNEHYVAGGIVGVGAINNPFEGRKKESYEDAFEYFLEKKYNLKEAEEEVMVDSGMIKSYIDEMTSLADDMEYTPEMVKGLQDLKAKLSGGKMSVKDALSKMEETIKITGDSSWKYLARS